MKTTLLFFIVLSTLSAQAAGLVSPLSSTIPGIDLPNAHYVDQDETIVRGMSPVSYLDDLEKLAVDEVLIFKNETKDEVTKEIEVLEQERFSHIKVKHIPFAWKNFSSVQTACEQVIDGLKTIKLAKKKNHRLYFHCTVGEDRTGMLAGLWRMLEDKLDTKRVFKEEMCERGYAEGDQHKPAQVVRAIEKELSPLFFALAAKIEAEEMSLEHLDKKICADLELAPKIMACKNMH